MRNHLYLFLLISYLLLSLTFNLSKYTSILYLLSNLLYFSLFRHLCKINKADIMELLYRNHNHDHNQNPFYYKALKQWVQMIFRNVIQRECCGQQKSAA